MVVVFGEALATIILGVVNVISFPIMLFCTLYMFRYYCGSHGAKRGQNTVLTKHMRNATLCCTSSACVRAIILVLTNIERYPTVQNVPLLEMYTAIDFMLALNIKFCIFIIFILRLQMCFQDSVYAYANRVFYLIWVLLALELVFTIVLLLARILFFDSFLAGASAAFLLFSNDLCLSVFTVYLFVHRLHQIIVKQMAAEQIELSVSPKSIQPRRQTTTSETAANIHKMKSRSMQSQEAPEDQKKTPDEPVDEAQQQSVADIKTRERRETQETIEIVYDNHHHNDNDNHNGNHDEHSDHSNHSNHGHHSRSHADAAGNRRSPIPGQSQSRSRSRSRSQSQNHMSVSKTANFVEVVTRYTLIGSIAIITSAIAQYLLVADFLSLELDPRLLDQLINHEKISVIKFFSWFMLPIDNISNVLCVFFNNSFAVYFYMLLCNPCHKGCRKCFHYESG